MFALQDVKHASVQRITLVWVLLFRRLHPYIALYCELDFKLATKLTNSIDIRLNHFSNRRLSTYFYAVLSINMVPLQCVSAV